jgi:hypothetical protein
VKLWRGKEEGGWLLVEISGRLTLGIWWCLAGALKLRLQLPLQWMLCLLVVPLV